MKGDYNETDASQLGRWRVDWGIVAVVVGGLALGVFSFFASGCAIGAEPVTFAVVNRVPPKFEVVNRIPPAVKSAPSPPKLIGWNVPQPDGSVLFVPVQQPTPPGAMTIPAPVGGPAPDPFAGGSGTIPTIPAITAVRPSTSSPDPVRLPGHIRIGVPGAAIRGFTDGCASPFG